MSPVGLDEETIRKYIRDQEEVVDQIGDILINFTDFTVKSKRNFG